MKDESLAGTSEGNREGPKAPQAGQWWHVSFRPPSILASLVIVALIPFVVAAVLCSSVVLNQLSSVRHADSARQASLSLDALLTASVDLYQEYEPSEALIAAEAYHLSPEQLNALLQTNNQSELGRARREVDRQAVFGPGGQFAHLHAQLIDFRRSVDKGTASLAGTESFFTGLVSRLDEAWQRTFDRLQVSGEWTDSPATRGALDALGDTFAAFTAGIGEETLRGGGSLETVLTTAATPAETVSLVASHEQFVATTSDFPGILGPLAGRSWTYLQRNPLDAAFTRDVRLGISSSLGHDAPALATDSSEIGSVARSEVAWAGSLTDVVLASSADLRAATVSQAGAASREVSFTIAAMAALLLVEVAAVLLVGRQVRRPLTRIVEAATMVREGELELPRLPETGPRELALAAAAFNEMSSTLLAVQEQAIALSDAEFEDPALHRGLPGRTGAALQSAFMKLHSSVRRNERRRRDLAEQATRDSLTGLLNRGAALEALQRDLASVHRSNGELELTLLFIDVDDLKMVNDTYGHDQGDLAIQLVADALRSGTRASDVVARLGGDEFIVGSLQPRGVGVPEATAERIVAHLAAAQEVNDRAGEAVGCSIGAVVSEPADDRIESLIERADRALYVAKSGGRGQLRWSLPPATTADRVP